MSPMQLMAKTLTRPAWSFPTVVLEQPAETKTERIRALLRTAGPKRSLEIVMELDLDISASVVGSLLKNDLHKGAVVFQDGRYAWNPDYDQALAKELAEARDLLRRHGYLVEKA